MQRSNGTDATALFLLGGLIGAGVALLLAPRPGSEIRGLIGERLRESADRGRELTDRATQRGRELVDEARHGVQWQKDRLAAAIEAGRDAYREEKSQA